MLPTWIRSPCRSDLPPRDQRGVDERAVGRAEILDERALAVDLKLEVPARDLVVVEHEVGGRIAPDDDDAGDLEQRAGIGPLNNKQPDARHRSESKPNSRSANGRGHCLPRGAALSSLGRTEEHGSRGERRGRRGGRRGRIVLMAVVVLVLLAAAAIIGVVLATRDEDETTERPFNAQAVTGFVVIEGAKVTAAGTYKGTPGGTGAVAVTLFPQGDLRKGKPVPLKGNVKIYLDGGPHHRHAEGHRDAAPAQRVRGQGNGEDRRRHGHLRRRHRLVRVRRRPGDGRDRRQAEVHRHDRVLNFRAGRRPPNLQAHIRGRTAAGCTAQLQGC